MNIFIKVGFLLILIGMIIIFNKATSKPLVEGHGGGGGGGGRGGGGFGGGRGFGGFGVGRARLARGVGLGGAGVISNGYYNDDSGYYGYIPTENYEYAYDLYGNPIIVRPTYF